MRLKLRAAFTLIELMIAVAIVSVLAATAIVGFDRYKRETIASERGLIGKTIVEAQIAYYNKPRMGAGGVELESCMLWLNQQPNWTQYTTGVFDWPVDFDFPTIWDSDWNVIGVPTRDRVYYAYWFTNEGTLGSSKGPPGCASASASPGSGGNAKAVRIWGDLDGDNLPSITRIEIHERDDGTLWVSPLVLSPLSVDGWLD